MRLVSRPAILSLPRRLHTPLVVYRPTTIRLNSSSTTITTDGVHIPQSVIEMSVEEYHKLADESLETMIEDLEEFMDSSEIEDLDAELSVSSSGSDPTV